jgi:serine/threonine protein kinase/formylglycine-generating enzyme required for sulfatase activity
MGCVYCPACQSEYPADWKACPKDATHLLKSAQIGKYRIEGLMGVGGMGAVYRAINPDTKGRVAVKVMNPAVAAAESARARFQREAAAVAALRTAHVVKVYDFGTETDGTLYLVMELLDGHALRDEINAPPDTMNLARVQMVLDGALKGLGAAHRAGIVHRDLKPENVYVADTDDGEVPKLLDFGIARVRTRDSDLTRTGSLMGTAAYMAPEQIASGIGEIGPWSDVYAMGAILYEMLSGTSAYGGETVTEVLTNALKGEVVPLSTVRAGLPPAIYELVARCMSPDPALRPQDAEQMRGALERARLVAHGTQVPPASRTQAEAPARTSLGLGLEATQARPTPATTPTHRDHPITSMPAPVATSPTDSVMRGPKRKLWPIALVGALVAAGAAFAIVNLTRSAPVSTPDAGAIVTIDSAPPDAAVVVTVDAAVPIDAGAPSVTAGMIRIPAGDYEVGEDPKGDPAALAKQTVHTDELWIDAHELTLGELQAALGTTAGGAAGDAPDLPARRVTWEAASAACAKLGKRLPTELEWEIAARMAPTDAASATLLRGKPGLVASPKRECSSAGLCDLIGSVAEWTSTAGSTTTKIARGASYMVAPTSGWHATIHARAQVKAKSEDDELGVRCAYRAGAADGPTKPKPPPKKPPPAKPKCDDLEELRKTMRNALKAERNALALTAAETLIACGQSNVGVVFHAAVAACRLRNVTKAKLHFAAMPQNPRKQLVRDACLRNNIELP